MMHNMQLSDYLAKNPKKYLIFDFDETIAKLEMDWSDWHGGMANIYRQFDQKQVEDYSSDEHRRYNNYAKKFGQKLVVLTKFFNAEYEARMTRELSPYPELVEFIKDATGYQLSIYSSNSKSTVLKGLKALGIAEKFEQIVSRDEVTFIKPDPEGFALIYDLKVPKSEYLMIGNSFTDQGMAEAAGIDFYLVEYFRPIF